MSPPKPEGGRTADAGFRGPVRYASNFGVLRAAARVVAWLRSQVVGFVARVPARVQTKLLVAFLAMVALLIVLGVAGLRVLSEAHHRTEDLIRLHRKIAAYHQVQQARFAPGSVAMVDLDWRQWVPGLTTKQLHQVSSALELSRDQALFAALRQLNQFGYDLELLLSIAKDEADLVGQVRQVHGQFVGVVTQVVELVRAGEPTEARAMLVAQARPLADRLEHLVNQLVNRAEADMMASIAMSPQSFATSQAMVIGLVLGSVALALVLGYAISWSLVEPVTTIEAQLRRIAGGNFSERIHVANRDELGALAANVNRMCEELGLVYQQLETANRHKSEFLANTSHELRTPLNAVLGYAELIEDNIYGEVPPKIREVLQRIQSNGRHLLGLINDILDLSKIEAGQLQLSVTVYSMKEVIARVVTATEGLAAEKKLLLRAIIPETLPTGTGDERRITQVLLNLVGNAIKFTEEGEVAVRATVQADCYELSVSDTGPGIPAEERQRIFDEFHQLDTSSTRTKGGTGLGLAISKKIVEFHGGRIWVESEVGHGSVFYVTLPVRAHKVENVT
jgi:signal transduction histidine kinase